MTWLPVDYKTEKLVSGTTYRGTLWLPLPDTLDWKKKVVDVIKNVDIWIHKLPEPLQFGYQKWKILKVETGASVASATNVRLRPWPVRIEFTYINKAKAPGGEEYLSVNQEDNFVGIDDAIEAFIFFAGLIAIVAIGVTIISKSLEKLIKPIFNPGVLVIALIAIVVIMRGRKVSYG